MKIIISNRSRFVVLGILIATIVAYITVPKFHEVANMVATILSEHDTQKAITGFRDYLLSFGAYAPVVSAALMIGIQVVFAPIPTFFVTLTNGLLFGWAWGAALSWASSMVGATACFWIARSLGRPVVQKLVGGSKALEVTDLFFVRYGNRAVLISRLLPFMSFRVVSYGAGLTPVKFWQFLLATGIGQLPATLLYSYLGGQLSQSVKVLFWVFSITAAIFILGWTLGPRFMTRIRSETQNAEGNLAANHPIAETEKV